MKSRIEVPRLMTKQQVADYLQRSVRTINRYIAARKLTAYKFDIDDNPLFDVQEVLKLIGIDNEEVS